MPKTAMAESRLERLCAERGMRMTGQRRTIARVLSEAEDHPDVEEVYRRASARDPRISLSTVYRTVRLFEGAGILERHEFGDGRARYEPAGLGHHDHLINVKTGEVIEFSQRADRAAAGEPWRASSASASSATGSSCSACRSRTASRRREGETI